MISIGTQPDVIMAPKSDTDDTLVATPRAWGGTDNDLVTCKSYNECEIMLGDDYYMDEQTAVPTFGAVSSDSAVSVTPIKGGLRLTVSGVPKENVTIDELTATDSNGLTFKDVRTITVVVDPRPTDQNLRYTLEAERGSPASTSLIPDLNDFFENKPLAE